MVSGNMERNSISALRRLGVAAHICVGRWDAPFDAIIDESAARRYMRRHDRDVHFHTAPP